MPKAKFVQLEINSNGRSITRQVAWLLQQINCNWGEDKEGAYRLKENREAGNPNALSDFVLARSHERHCLQLLCWLLGRGNPPAGRERERLRETEVLAGW